MSARIISFPVPPPDTTVNDVAIALNDAADRIGAAWQAATERNEIFVSAEDLVVGLRSAVDEVQTVIASWNSWRASVDAVPAGRRTQ